MNKNKLFGIILAAGFFTLLIVGCGGGNKEAKYTETMEKLAKHSWKLQVNDVISDVTGDIDTATGIEADIVLDGDVGDFANFLAETLWLGRGKDASLLVCEKTYGEGILSTSALGKWEVNEENQILTLYMYDDSIGDYGEGIDYNIVEVTDEKLLLKKEDGVLLTYKAK